MSTAALRPLGGALAVFVVLGLAVYGLERLKDHVYGLPEYSPEFRVILDEPPEWVTAEGWKSRILESIRLPQETRWLDDSLVREIHDRVLASGWVAKVNHVVQDMNGTIRVDCAYRRPIAMVHFDHAVDEQIITGFVAVDEEGVRLPELYHQVDEDLGWLRILGVESPLPPVGEPFSGEDARAAIQLCRVLSRQAYAPRISAINIRNFRGRHNRHDTHIYLLTRDGGRIKWGSAIGEEMEEPSWKDKLKTIGMYFKSNAPQALIDASVYVNGVIIEPSPPSLRTADMSRSRQ